MNTRLLKIVILASGCTIGCSGADPSSTGELAAPVTTATARAAMAVPTATARAITQPIADACENAYENCIANGGDDTACTCEREKCEGKYPFSCRPQLQ